MGYLYIFIKLLACLFLVNNGVYGLIGLRPPNQAPHHDDVRNQNSHTSPKPAQMHRTQLHTPYETLMQSHSFIVNETRFEDTHDGHNECQPVTILQCSYTLLHHAIHNNIDFCASIQGFTECILDKTRKLGRRNFVIAISALEHLHVGVPESYRCHGNMSTPDISHSRHRLSKRHKDTCCTTNTLQCAIQTFMKMTHSPQDTCSLVNLYDVCMNDVVTSCHLDTGSTSYLDVVTKLKNDCRGKIRRHRRTKRAPRHG